MSFAVQPSSARTPVAIAEALPETERKLLESQVLSGPAHLLFFTLVQLLVYFDRSVISGLIGAIEDEFEISNFWSGLLGSGFMGGFIVASPIAAVLAGPRSAKIMGIGLAVWCVASVMASMATTASYTWLLMARVAAGAGEAAYCSLAPPMIDDTAPPLYKSLYLSIYFSTIFVGMALGLVAQAPFKKWDEARFIFFLEALAMAPCVAYLFLRGDKFHTMGGKAPVAGGSGLELQHRPSTAQENSDAQAGGGEDGRGSRMLGGDAPQPWYGQVMAVLESRTYNLVLLGYTASMFSLGGLAFWVPTYVEKGLGVPKETAGKELGVMAASCGIVGTIAGGVLLDVIATSREQASGQPPAGSHRLSIRGQAAVKVTYRCAQLAIPFMFIAVAFKVPSTFFFAMILGQLFIFMSTAPINVAMLEATPPHLRGLAMGIATFATHVFGDVTSPVLIGQVFKYFEAWGSWQYTPGMLMLGMWPLFSVFFWRKAAKEIS